MLNKNGLRLANKLLLGASLVVCAAAPVFASVTLGGTRVILGEQDREASIPVKNAGRAPYVIQAWVDAGEGKTKTPFVVTPPLSRLDPGMENILRIMRISNNLPTDRESVFWLNVKEIPEKAKEDNVLQIAMRTRIKLFYRPSALEGKPAESRHQLKWAVIPGNSSTGSVLKIENPTPYYITFTSFKINQGQQEINAQMVPPKGESVYSLSSVNIQKDIDVRFTTINDYGGETPEERATVPVAVHPIVLPLEPVKTLTVKQ
ncbi:fimbrial biogenesis chaperone [Pseudomonas sessilinigenes]|uniref:Molecular chaperone n=1 Tax=Pseudomonas sessilinigenes TaxID=658629 RepID=A0ABX8MU37_9PSED|nr:molecular chaperone [Pseudomonas sessilinigenes]AZC22615.1 pili assembly chaperone [Pseudomonas sessilinigenes]QXH41664.1 molecular chaperone [Pseudomonas sessilinigenes]